MYGLMDELFEVLGKMGFVVLIIFLDEKFNISGI